MDLKDLELQADSAIKGREEAIKQLRKLQVGYAWVRVRATRVDTVSSQATGLALPPVPVQRVFSTTTELLVAVSCPGRAPLSGICPRHSGHITVS